MTHSLIYLNVTPDEGKGLKHTLAASWKDKGQPTPCPPGPPPPLRGGGRTGRPDTGRTLSAGTAASASAQCRAHGRVAPRCLGIQPRRRSRSPPVAFDLLLVHAYDKHKNRLRASLRFPRASQRTAQERWAADVSGPAGRLLGWAQLAPHPTCGKSRPP